MYTELEFEKIKHKKYKYKLKRNYYYILENKYINIDIKTEYIEIRKTHKDNIRYMKFCKGYAWDGGSGPAIDNNPMLIASLQHDGFYQLIREGPLNIKFRKIADIIFRKKLIEYGSWKIRAWWCYFAVRFFGKSSCKRRNENEEV